ncbi:TRAP transporter small permease [Hoyosella sp. YIM 151337]|uniref:TRAP transporter small permease n=1 Tax=Hoyosella sp. YIM 151337 TaxID=2992742 RepID=UPI002236A44E|nr:TRAP transporter small permease [Hoyosella sp. YIM 151337]MCW4355936.1 TRAP transporter small permease [Hoyosella sp. YIM 151337]
MRTVALAVKLSRLVNTAIQAIAVIAVVAIMLHTVANALMRYALAEPITGTQEFVQYWYMPLAVLLGIYLAQRGRDHIEARLIFDRLPLRVQLEAQIFGQVLAIALASAFTVFGMNAAIDAYMVGQTGGASGIVTWPVYFVVPLAFALFALQLMLDLVMVMRSRNPDAAAVTTIDSRGK